MSQSSNAPVSAFLRHHYRHFNAAALIDAADGYVRHLDQGGKMMVTLAGAMSTAELGLSLAEMIRQDKVHAITCTGANLEEDIYNLVAHDHYERVPNYRDLTPQDEQALLEKHFNRVTDTCIPETVMRHLESRTVRDTARQREVVEAWSAAARGGNFEALQNAPRERFWQLAGGDAIFPILRQLEQSH